MRPSSVARPAGTQWETAECRGDLPPRMLRSGLPAPSAPPHHISTLLASSSSWEPGLTIAPLGLQLGRCGDNTPTPVSAMKFGTALRSNRSDRGASSACTHHDPPMPSRRRWRPGEAGTSTAFSCGACTCTRERGESASAGPGAVCCTTGLADPLLSLRNRERAPGLTSSMETLRALFMGLSAMTASASTKVPVRMVLGELPTRYSLPAPRHKHAVLVCEP